MKRMRCAGLLRDQLLPIRHPSARMFPPHHIRRTPHFTPTTTTTTTTNPRPLSTSTRNRNSAATTAPAPVETSNPNPPATTSPEPPQSSSSPPPPPPQTAPTTLPPCRSPTTSAKLAALHARLSLHPKFPVQTLARALIHPSADPNPLFNNRSLTTLGSALINYYATEWLLCTYPRLPAEVLRAALSAYVGAKALASMGREWGVESAFEPKADVDAGLLQFKRLPPGPEVEASGYKWWQEKGERWTDGVPEEEATASFVTSTFAGVYLHEGVGPVKQFFRQHVLSRKLDIDKLFNFVQPTRELSSLCSREGFEPPIARHISETGRRSIAPVFVVGVYSGLEKIGEGHGGSMNEARIRAAVNALKGWYLYSPAPQVDLPSKTDDDPHAPFRPAVIDVGEVIV
ncbi:ribonuclease III domain-containing protein [Tuber indicum]|nr:ribonuclease III domain-containing protein [Tuber indicum]